MRYRPGDDFSGLRIEHRPPDGPPRVLAETTVWSIAGHSVAVWVPRLRRQDRRGEVVIVSSQTGEVLLTSPIPPKLPKG